MKLLWITSCWSNTAMKWTKLCCFCCFNKMSSPFTMHFSIENCNEDFNMLTIIWRSNILELNFVHPKGHKTMCFEWIGRSWIFTLCETKSVHLTWNSPFIDIGCCLAHGFFAQCFLDKLLFSWYLYSVVNEWVAHLWLRLT